MGLDLIKVKSWNGEIFNVYYSPNNLCWIKEGTNEYFDDEDWSNGVIQKA